MVVGVCNVEVVGCVENEALGRVKLGSGGWACVAGPALGAGTGDGGEDASGVEFADDVVGCLCDLEIALGVEDDGGGKEKRSGGGRDYWGLGLSLGLGLMER